eukprot:TRINITY_DN5441_c0_g1_i4.p1 TRINITY_DN5441_c0_g1~~TRINITY_DN5441_c0_g1_i4.p1  ORF type:complete len:975 (+),score=317.26 TRINITY_DN5441_c0_g1_i4:183-3107(+)
MPPKGKKKKAPTEEGGEDFSKWTVAKLKVRLTELGLDTSGKKADLVERLQSGGSGEAEESEAPPAKKAKKAPAKPAPKKKKAPAYKYDSDSNSDDSGNSANSFLDDGSDADSDEYKKPAKKKAKPAPKKKAAAKKPANVTQQPANPPPQLAQAAQVFFEDGSFKAEYAKSSRSTCKRCNELIMKDTLRLAKMVPSDKFDGMYPIWQHDSCFLGGALLPTHRGLIAGYSTLRPQDQALIGAKIPSSQQASGGAVDPAKAAEDDKVAKQNEKVFEVKDALETLSNGEIKDMLDLNDYPTQKFRVSSTPVELVADGIMFGATQRCEVCADTNKAGGHVLLNGEGYKCTGSISEFLRCNFRTQQPKRTKWVLTSEAKAIPALKALKLATGDRLFSGEMQTADQEQGAPAEQQALPALLNLQAVIEISAAAKKKAIKLIEENGGQVHEEVTKAASCVIATQDWADSHPKEVAAAEEMGVPGVTDAFLAASVKANSGQWADMTDYLIWGKARRRQGQGAERKKVQSAKQVQKMGVFMDSDVGDLVKTAHVLVDKSAKKVYSEMLTATDMRSGTNSFYTLHLLESDKPKKKSLQYWVFRKWGRIGVNQGGNKLEEFEDDKDAAIANFTKLYYEKTGNRFGQSSEFQAIPGKHVRVDVEHSALDPNANNNSQEASAEGGDAGQPLGQLSKAQILKADKVLDKIQALLKAGVKTPKDDAMVLSHSAQYYTYVPHDFGTAKPPPIDNDKLLGAEQALLQFYLRMGFDGVEDAKDVDLAPIAGVMELPLADTLGEAAAGICPVAEVNSCVTKGAVMAKKGAGSPKVPMSPDLYGSILLYTGNAIYRDLNTALREEDRKKIKKYFPYLRMLLEAAGLLPQETTTLWRGIGVDLLDQYKVGQTITWWSVSSCTADKKVAQSFANSCGSSSTFITVETKTACNIAQVSFYANEAESLLLPGTQLEVLSSKRVGKQAHIHLKEVGRAFS